LKSNPVKIVLFGIILYFTIISLGSYNTIQIQQNYEYKTDQIDFGCDMICNQRDEIGFNSLNIMDSNSNIENYCSVGYFITYIDGYRESSIILNFSEYLNVISDSIEEIPNYMQVSNISNRIQTESRESLEAIPIFVSEVFALRYNYELNDSFALYYPLDEYSIQLNCVVEYILTNLPGFNFGEENAASDPISIIIPSLTEINYDNLRFDQKIIMINLFHNDLNSKITTYIDLKESYFFEFLHIKYFNPSETDISLMIYETIAMEFIALTIIMMVLLGFFLKQDLNLYQNKYDKLHLMGVNLIRIKEERKKIQFLELLVFLGVDLSLTVIFIYFFYRFQCLCANFGVNLINPMEPTYWTFYYSTNFPMVVEKVIPFSISPICCLLFLLLGVFYIYSLIQQIREKKYVKSL